MSQVERPFIKNIALAMVPVAHAQPGTDLTVETSLGTAMARVVPIPFIQPHT